jgi:4-hydroxy-3-polyprenylbenzoate decarboxylase
MIVRTTRDMGDAARRVVVGISGASGSTYGIRLLESLEERVDLEVHLVVSAAGKRTLVEETSRTVKEVEALADVVYDDRDIGASLASGSFRTEGMIIAPCSIKTLAALASCHADTLIARAGDVTLKEGRPLVALVRETPLHVGHLRQMLAFAEMGGIVFPPMPAFYHKPATLDDIVDHTVARVLQRVGLEDAPRPGEWTGGGRPPSAR